MVADYDYIGEWGFAAIIESDGNKILFDTNSGLHVTAGTSGVANVSLSTFSYDKKGGVPAPTISDNTKY